MNDVRIIIDSDSGFCFGVVNAIEIAEQELNQYDSLYCLGDIVHNNKEVERLENQGLRIIKYEKYKQLHDCSVLIRAHGEPPETYKIAFNNNIRLIDASCPVVLQLQNSVRLGFEDSKTTNAQIVIFGKKKHAEVIGLEGQVFDNAIVVNGIEDIEQLDYNTPIYLYSQTTQSLYGYRKLIEAINLKYTNKGNNPDDFLTIKHTICGKVSNRSKQISDFVKDKDIVIFVSGKKSSNGKVLFELAQETNKNTYFISDQQEIEQINFPLGIKNIGICGATSTPKWLMEDVAKQIKEKCFPKAMLIK